METLECRSPRTCPACPHSTREGACRLEADLAAALGALAGERRLAFVAPPRKVAA